MNNYSILNKCPKQIYLHPEGTRKEDRNAPLI